jgi:hypothetical protein
MKPLKKLRTQASERTVGGVPPRRVQLTIRLRPDERANLDRMALERGLTSAGGVLRVLLAAELQRERAAGRKAG